MPSRFPFNLDRFAAMKERFREQEPTLRFDLGEVADERAMRDDAAIAKLASRVAPNQDVAPSGKERRRRRRVKMAVRILVRGGIGTTDPFEEVATTVDVTRDGVMFATDRGGYWAGQAVEVTFPYSDKPGTINMARSGKVARCVLLPGLRFGIGVKLIQKGANGNGNGNGWALPATPYPNQVRVLGVDSDSQAAQTLRGLLEQDGYHVVMVGNAREALDILRDETPDVILAEAEGGEISGKDLCAIVKTSERLQHVPVILLTKSALPSDYKASRQLGATVCMMKPCKPMRLQKAVHLVAPPPSHRSVYRAETNIVSFVRTS
jgi:CheY-like chemotaxis protein